LRVATTVPTMRARIIQSNVRCGDVATWVMWRCHVLM
jgi:hypothetical protein